MWNSFKTDAYSGILAETVVLPGRRNVPIHAYWSRPLGTRSAPSLVLIPHMPGWDEWCRETARRFSEHGYAVLCPNIYEEVGHGTPSEVAQRSMDRGGVPDGDVMGDVAASLGFLRAQPASNGKVGVIGMCSGGRHTFLAACTVPGIDAAVDCWGGGVVCPPEKLTPARPVAPIDYAEGLQCPLLGIFGNEDWNPTREDVDVLEARLKELGKDYEFHRYDGASHGIWYYHRPMYRWDAAMDSFDKTLEFLDRHLK